MEVERQRGSGSGQWMSEAEPNSQELYFATKYSCPRDEILGEMGLQGWANASSGDVASPTGYFERITNTPEELAEVEQAFEDVIARMRQYGFTADELLGHFLLVHDDQGFVGVHEYDTHEELVQRFEELEEAYSEWGSDDE